LSLPAPVEITSAQALVSADNAFVLFVNGQEVSRSAPGSETWRNPKKFEFSSTLHAGDNIIGVVAENTSDQANPAGIIGRFEIRSTSGEVIHVIDTDHSWQVSKEPSEGWNVSPDVPGEWVAAEEIARYGEAPWGRLGTTAIRQADPFEGMFTLPEGIDQAQSRICIEMEGVYEGARLTVNGSYAGGVIGAPYRIDITKHLKPGENTLLVEPYAPEKVWVSAYE
jgi:hypothetical protein